jgi:hypothetical protein
VLGGRLGLGSHLSGGQPGPGAGGSARAAGAPGGELGVEEGLQETAASPQPTMLAGGDWPQDRTQ